MPNRPWTPGSLHLLRSHAKRGYGNGQLAAIFKASRAEVDLALWTLLGRTPAEAAAALNKRKAA